MIMTFSEGEPLARLPFMNIAGVGLYYSVEKELLSLGFQAVNVAFKQFAALSIPNQRPCAGSGLTWMWPPNGRTSG